MASKKPLPRSPNKPYIAKDTKEPLVILGHYPVAEDGSIMRQTLPPPGPKGDTGCDPLGEGRFRMHPSGDIVDFEEMCRRRGKEHLIPEYHKMLAKNGGKHPKPE